jgi:hypothetical protein
MTLSLTTVQRLLVFSALAWAALPSWGGFAFGASWLLMALGTHSRTRRAGAVLEANLDKLSSLPAEAIELTRRFPLGYVWPGTAERWADTWQMTGLLALVLGVVFLLWALLTQTTWYLFLLIPLSIQLVVGGVMAGRLKVAERVREDLKDLRAIHDTTVTLLNLKTTVGQWPPEPSPDPEPEGKRGR